MPSPFSVAKLQRCCQENSHAPASEHIYIMRTKYRIHPTLTVPLSTYSILTIMKRELSSSPSL